MGGGGLYDLNFGGCGQSLWADENNTYDESHADGASQSSARLVASHVAARLQLAPATSPS